MIDTHIHLDHRDYAPDFDEVYARAKAAGIKSFIIPGASLEDLPRAVELSEKYHDIYFAVGVHPYDIDGYDEALLKQFINHPKCVAVGECGLDYYRLPKEEHEKELNKARQKEVFIAQIELAKAYQKPLIVHVREATHESKVILDEYASELKGVLHCFNASPELLQLKGDFYYGIGGVLTFSNAKALVEILPKIPLDKLLLETDGPYLTPHPHRGKRNESAYLPLVLSKMSELLSIDTTTLRLHCETNTQKLFNFYQA